MKYKLLSIFTAFLIVSSLFSCSSSDPDPIPKEQKKTVVAFIAGKNNLESLANKDVEEMKVGLASVDLEKNNLLVFFKKSSSAQLFILKKENDRIVKEVVKEYSTDINSLKIENMTDILHTAYSSYPAESYGLIFWSHSDSWLPASNPANVTRSWGSDEHKQMNVQNLKKAIEAGAPRLDFILFDSCLMQAIEVATELETCTDYMIASPTEIPGPGADYREVIPAIFSDNSGEALAVAIAESYYLPYEKIYDDTRPTTDDYWTGGVSIGVMSLKNMQELTAQTADIFKTLDTEELNLNSILYYDRKRGNHYLYDIKQVIKEATKENTQRYNAWENAFSRAMIYFKTTDKNYSAYQGLFLMKGACGLSTYIPTERTSDVWNFYKTLKWYNISGWNLN